MCTAVLPAAAASLALVCVAFFVVWLCFPDLTPDDRVGRFILRRLSPISGAVCLAAWIGSEACRAGIPDTQPLPLGILIYVISFVSAGFLIGALHQLRPQAGVLRSFVGVYAFFSALWVVAILDMYF